MAAEASMSSVVETTANEKETQKDEKNEENGTDAKSPSIANHFKVPQPMFDPEDKESVIRMVGHRVAVRWNDLAQFPTWGSKWYRGTVVKYDKTKKLLKVRYDDSDVSWYTMSEKTFRIEGEGFLYDGEKKKWPEPHKWGKDECLKWLLRKSAELGDVDTISRTLEQTPSMLDAGLDTYGWTLLTISAEHGHTIAVHKLLTLGASVNTGTESGTTPVYAAARGGHWHIVDALIKRGADVNQAHQDGSTPLAEASYAGHVDIVKTLIESEADVSIARKDLFTPLMAATVHGHYEVAKLLIHAGADHTTVQLDMPSDRSTALDRAQTDQMQKLIQTATPAHTRRTAFLVAKRFRREWARVLAASARITSCEALKTQLPSSEGPDEPGVMPQSVTEALEAVNAAQMQATEAHKAAAVAAPYCKAWKKRFNPFNRRCLHCSRLREACEWSRMSRGKAIQAQEKIQLAKMMLVVTFMSERPGLVRVVGTRLLRYL